MFLVGVKERCLTFFRNSVLFVVGFLLISCTTGIQYNGLSRIEHCFNQNTSFDEVLSVLERNDIGALIVRDQNSVWQLVVIRAIGISDQSVSNKWLIVQRRHDSHTDYFVHSNSELEWRSYIHFNFDVEVERTEKNWSQFFVNPKDMGQQLLSLQASGFLYEYYNDELLDLPDVNIENDTLYMLLQWWAGANNFLG